jgi:FkbM family methyltransferase
LAFLISCPFRGMRMRALLLLLLRLAVGVPVVNRAAEVAGVHLSRRYPRLRAVRWYTYHLGRLLAQTTRTERVAALCNGARIVVNLEEQYARDLYFHGVFEGDLTRIVTRLVTEGSVVFDVGANLGYYTCLTAPLVGRTGSVHAFEPDPDSFGRLAKTVAMNGFACRIDINNLAVHTASDQDLRLYTSTTADGKGLASMIHDHQWGRFDHSVVVKTIALGDYIRAHAVGRIDLMKIDVEGWEILALRGMEDVLRYCPPKAMLIESTSDGLVGPNELVAYLRGFGYTAHDTLGGLREVDEVACEYVNLLFLQPQANADTP